MPTLVLDKSVLQSAPKGWLKSRRQEGMDFLLTGALMQEIGSDGLRLGVPLSESGRSHAISTNFRRAVMEAGNNWIDSATAVEFEITHGESAKHGPRFHLNCVPDVEMIPSETQDASISLERRYAKLASVGHFPDDEEYYRRIISMTEKEALLEIDRALASEDCAKKVVSETAHDFAQAGRQRGLSVSSAFVPQEDWYTYGYSLALWAFLPYKFNKFHDGPPDRKKPANAMFDLEYIAACAICDGIVSKDKDMLKLAWACWRKKRESILYFNDLDKTCSPFVPW
ncbi:MAG TPA: hypothetical protein PLP01_13195 [Phycisphaerae bacterium]|nr:hypothetical protein [Phycisphaerae bacterium]HOI56201.1 hypothetical protein [Phycisphaerae bacterium]